MNPAGTLALGASMLVVLFYTCIPGSARRIEAQLTVKAQTALLRAGLPSDGLAVSGRDAVLSGVKGSVQTGEQALRIVSQIHGIRAVRANITDPPRIEPPMTLDTNVVAQEQSELDRLGRRVEFEPSSAKLTTEGQIALDELGEALKKYPLYPIEIQGHTSNEGDAAANLELSRRRAATARIYLIAKGVASTHLTAVGYGHTVPKISNQTPEGRRLNQRLEFRVKAARQ